MYFVVFITEVAYMRKYEEYYHNNTFHYSSALDIYYAGKEECEPGHSFGPAVRIHYLIHFIISGKGIFRIDDQTYHLCANQLFLIKPGEKCYYEADLENPWSYLWVGFNGTEATSLLQNSGLLNGSPVLDLVSNSLIFAAMNDIISRFQSREENTYFLLGSLYTIFGYLTKAYREKIGLQTQNTYLKQALNFIHNNYQHHIKIQDICNYLQIDRTYFYRLFMNEFHISPKHYLISYQLQMSLLLLTNSNMSVKEIAYACGFTDPSSYNQLFLKKYGRTPGKSRVTDGVDNLTWSFIETKK